MNNRTHILNELESIAPVLVNTPVNMPYSTPENYFETLPAEILNQLGLDENHALAPHIVTASNENLYQVPAGYFEGLADRIMDRIYSEENTAAVPEGYFNSLPDILLGKVRGIEVKEELEALAPLLNTIDKKPVNFVPEGYFNNLQPELEVAAEAPPEIKVVSIKKKSNWLKYAVAACFTGAIAFTAIKIIDRPPVTTTGSFNPEKEFAAVADSTLENYLTKDQSVSEFSAMATNIVNEDDITDFLKEFSDEELQQYLKNEGEAVASN